MVEGLQRVVVTGLGAVTPIGNTVSDYWEGLTSAKNGVEAITLFDAAQHACRFAAEVKNFDPSGFIEPKDAKRWDRFCKFGVVAAKQALADSGLTITPDNAHRIGVSIGSGVGGLLTMETQAHVLKDKAPGRVSPFTVPMMIPIWPQGLLRSLWVPKVPAPLLPPPVPQAPMPSVMPSSSCSWAKPTP